MIRSAIPAFLGFLSSEIRLDLGPLLRRLRTHPELVLAAIGIAIRVYTYAGNRAMWLDEMMLRGNIVDTAVFDFSAGLRNDQLAPLGFLVVERGLAALISGRNHVLRFLPMIAGVGSVVLFLRLAPMILSRRAALVALALFAFSDDLNYYSSEFKPYSLDVFFGVAATLLAAQSLGRSPSRRTVLWLLAVAACAPWFSFASAFVLAGCGAVLLFDALLAARFRDAAIYGLIGAAWLANFVVSYFASRALLSLATTMFRFWDFAFLRLGLPPTRDDLARDVGLLLEVFVNPLNLVVPARVQAGVILPLVLLVAGAVALGRRSPRAFLLHVGPIGLALIAAVRRDYPFHGRLILLFVPALFVLIAEGTDVLVRRLPSPSNILYKTVLVALLALPSWEAVQNTISGHIRDFNAHGDLHPNVFIDLPEKQPGPRRHSESRPDSGSGTPADGVR